LTAPAPPSANEFVLPRAVDSKSCLLMTLNSGSLPRAEEGRRQHLPQLHPPRHLPQRSSPGQLALGKQPIGFLNEVTGLTHLFALWQDSSNLPGRFSLLAHRFEPHLAHLCTHKLASAAVVRIINQRENLEGESLVQNLQSSRKLS
jgi:hypothetical protein